MSHRIPFAFTSVALLTASIAVLPAFAACTSATELLPATQTQIVVGEGCQPLLAGAELDEVSRGSCLLPYPSDFWRVVDPKTPTGFRTVLSANAKPIRTSGQTTDPHDVLVTDGASVVPTIVATLPSDIVRDGLPSTLDGPEVSTAATSPSLLVEADTGVRVPHYVDLLPSRDDAVHVPIVIRPIVPLRPRTRYIVALRGVRLNGGAAVLAPAPEGFRRLRDGRAADVPALAAIAERFDREIFAPLASASIPRDDLQLAWDFTTGSVESSTNDMLRVRELTLAWIAANPPAPKLLGVEPGTGLRDRALRFEIVVPRFVDKDEAGAVLVRGADGNVRQNGTTTTELLVTIPKSVQTGGAAGRLLAFGHGFFGSTDELVSESGATIADRLHAVTFGVPWLGMARPDLTALIATLGDRPEHLGDFAERVHQAMANWLVAIAAMKGPIAPLTELHRADGAPAYDASLLMYFGASQGHILGSMLSAISPDISRSVLNVGGGGFTHIMPRSGNFGPFSLAISATFRDPLIEQAFTAMAQRPLDRIDPITWSPFIEKTPLPGSPTNRRVLMQTGVGDNGIPNVASFLQARTLGARLVVPSPRNVPLLETTAGGENVTAITLFDYGVDTSSIDPSPTEVSVVHESVRVNPNALSQMDAFLKVDGVVIQPCNGPCDPE